MNKETIEDAKIKHKKFCIENNIENPPFSFEKGAKWERENSNVDVLGFEIATLKSLITDMDTTIKSKYSEEEVLDLLFDFQIHRNDLENCVEAREWFEEFKKK